MGVASQDRSRRGLNDRTRHTFNVITRGQCWFSSNIECCIYVWACPLRWQKLLGLTAVRSFTEEELNFRKESSFSKCRHTCVP